MFFVKTSHWELTRPCLSSQLKLSQGLCFLKYNCIATAVWLYQNNFTPRSTGIVGLGFFFILFCCLKRNIKSSWVHIGPYCCHIWQTDIQVIFTHVRILALFTANFSSSDLLWVHERTYQVVWDPQVTHREPHLNRPHDITTSHRHLHFKICQSANS